MACLSDYGIRANRERELGFKQLLCNPNKPVEFLSNSFNMSVIELGDSVPSLTPHVSFQADLSTQNRFQNTLEVFSHESMLRSKQATSVSLPKWNDNIGYEEGQERVLSKMITGYPR